MTFGLQTMNFENLCFTPAQMDDGLSLGEEDGAVWELAEGVAEPVDLFVADEVEQTLPSAPVNVSPELASRVGTVLATTAAIGSALLLGGCEWQDVGELAGNFFAWPADDLPASVSFIKELSLIGVAAGKDTLAGFALFKGLEIVVQRVKWGIRIRKVKRDDREITRKMDAKFEQIMEGLQISEDQKTLLRELWQVTGHGPVGDKSKERSVVCSWAEQVCQEVRVKSSSKEQERELLYVINEVMKGFDPRNTIVFVEYIRDRYPVLLTPDIQNRIACLEAIPLADRLQLMRTVLARRDERGESVGSPVMFVLANAHLSPDGLGAMTAVFADYMPGEKPQLAAALLSAQKHQLLYAIMGHENDMAQFIDFEFLLTNLEIDLSENNYLEADAVMAIMKGYFLKPVKPGGVESRCLEMLLGRCRFNPQMYQAILESDNGVLDTLPDFYKKEPLIMSARSVNRLLMLAGMTFNQDTLTGIFLFLHTVYETSPGLFDNETKQALALLLNSENDDEMEKRRAHYLMDHTRAAQIFAKLQLKRV